MEDMHDAESAWNKKREVKLLERQILAAGDSVVVARTMFDKPISVRCDEDLVIDYDKGTAYTEKRDE